MHQRLSILGLVVAVASVGAAAAAAPSSAAPRLVRVAKLDNPVHIAQAPGDSQRLFVVEQPGRVRVLVNGRLRDQPFLDIRDVVGFGGERGLFAIAFAPDYQTSRRFYVHFTNRAGDTRVVEYRRSSNANVAIRGTNRTVLTQDQPEPNHNGGQIAFGPDSMLYIGLGDGGGGNDQHGRRGNAQNLGTVLGKILRIDPRAGSGRPYSIPSGNPFVNRSGARREIWSYGLRNPWRFSFDRQTGDLIVGDVGQNAFEEIDFVSNARGRGRGANFGWRPFEGNRTNFNEPAPGHVRPVLTYSAGRGCSVVGGFVVRDPDSSLRGRYVYGDYCEGKVRSALLRDGGSSGDRTLGLNVPQTSTFGEDNRGRIYVASLGGNVFRIAG